jgi:hypothetical protein
VFRDKVEAGTAKSMPDKEEMVETVIVKKMEGDRAVTAKKVKNRVEAATEKKAKDEDRVETETATKMKGEDRAVIATKKKVKKTKDRAKTAKKTTKDSKSTTSAGPVNSHPDVSNVFRKATMPTEP